MRALPFNKTLRKRGSLDHGVGGQLSRRETFLAAGVLLNPLTQ
jgi:hypothetical protein